MKKILLFITVFAAMLYNSVSEARAEFCKTITEQFGNIDKIMSVNLTGTTTPDFPNVPKTQKEILAWVKEYIGGVSVAGPNVKPKGDIEVIPSVLRINVFKDVICPTIKNELSKRHMLERYEEDPTLLCTQLPSLIKMYSTKIIDTVITQTKNILTKIKIPSYLHDTPLNLAKQAMNKAIGLVIGILNHPVIQSACSTALGKLHQKDFTPEDIVVPDISIPMEIEAPANSKPSSMPMPPALPGPVVSTSSVPVAPPLNIDDARHVARASAHKIVEETGPLSPIEARIVAQEIKEAEVQSGAPVAPGLGAELEEILITGKFPTQTTIAVPQAPVQQIPKPQAISKGNVSNVFDEMKAAFAKRGIRQAMAGDDDNEDWAD